MAGSSTLVAPELDRDRTPAAGDGAVNVGSAERALSVLAGGALAAHGLRRRGLEGGMAALAGAMLIERGVTGHCRVYERLGVDTSGGDGAAGALPERRTYELRKSFTIQRPAAELYAYWRRLDNLPSFMHHLESVALLGDTRSRWVAAGPAGIDAEWEAEIAEDVPGERIAWRSVQGSRVANEGAVRFRALPHDRGTAVDVHIRYAPPAGRLGHTLAALFHEDPDHQVQEDLRRFKRLMETGQTVTTEGQTSCRH